MAILCTSYIARINSYTPNHSNLLSNVVAVIHWRTVNVIKSYYSTLHNTRFLANYSLMLIAPSTSNIQDNIMLSVDSSSIFKAINFVLNSDVINRSFHPWKMQVKFIKIAQGLFHKFRIK